MPTGVPDQDTAPIRLVRNPIRQSGSDQAVDDAGRRACRQPESIGEPSGRHRPVRIQQADRLIVGRPETACLGRGEMDVAVLLTRGDTYDDEPPESPSKVQSYTMVREGDTWRVAAFHNTQRGKVMERIQFLWYPGTRPAAE